MQKNDAARNLIANLDRDLVDSPVPEFARAGVGVGAGADDLLLSSSPGHRSFTNASPVIPEVLPPDSDLFGMREHTFVKTTFSKRAFFFLFLFFFFLAERPSPFDDVSSLFPFSSRQLSGVHGSGEKGGRAVFSL